MKEKKYFHFADFHTFKYDLYVDIMFKRRGDHRIYRKDRSLWIEVEDWDFCGELVNCIIPVEPLEYDLLVGLLSSKYCENVFGAINYLLRHYPDEFLRLLKSGKFPEAATETMLVYFWNEGGYLL